MLEGRTFKARRAAVRRLRHPTICCYILSVGRGALERGSRQSRGPIFVLRARLPPGRGTNSASRRHTRSVAVRVYALAVDLGVSSRELLEYLTRTGERVISASSTLHPGAEAAARIEFGHARTPTGGQPARRPAGQPRRPGPADDSGWDDHDPWSRCPQQVTAEEAARLCGVKPATVRQWASRGYLTAVGKRGRSHLYDSRELSRAQDDVRDRTRTSPPLTATARLRSKDLDAVVHGDEAARLVGVAPSTIRMWVLRRWLRPIDQPGRPLFRVKDVIRAARRMR